MCRIRTAARFGDAERGDMLATAYGRQDCLLLAFAAVGRDDCTDQRTQQQDIGGIEVAAGYFLVCDTERNVIQFLTAVLLLSHRRGQPQPGEFTYDIAGQV